MAKVNINNLKHIKRTEEKEILEYVSEDSGQLQIALFGMSGVGKTEIALSSLNTLHTGDFYSSYTLLHYDAAQITENCTNDMFYSLLIYKLIQKTVPNDINLTTVDQKDTFLSYLEKSSYRAEVKSNAKKALIASLSLLPTVGPQIYEILKMADDNKTQNYKTIQYVFREYINYLRKATGLLVFIDNIQNIPLNIIEEFFEIIRQSGNEIVLFTSCTLKDEEQLTKKLFEQYKLNNNPLVLEIESVSLDIFEQICESNLEVKIYYKVQQRLEYFYTLVQYGNMREIDELIFQINHNGINDLENTPTLQGIRALDEVKKDIVDLTALFPEGIKISFIKRILKYNQGCNEAQFKQSISSLCKMNYILIGDNETLRLQHDKLIQASKQNLEFAEEEERFIELMQSCKKFFSEAVYEAADNSEFVFCVNGLIELEKEINLVRHLGILEKYINILYSNFKYYQICQLYQTLSKTTIYGSQIATILPLRSITQILDSLQKTSVFKEGLKMSNTLSNYYNMDLYKSKFLLQSYHYNDAINVLKHNLNNYESWSIYLNALQHLRRDAEVRNHIMELSKQFPEYHDEEFYYIILRNSGHLFDFQLATDNISKALEYFKSLTNSFVESTCYNNLGILYLYRGLSKDGIQNARKHFKHAQKMMHQLKSNEEYQSIINIGISYFCEHDYTIALEYFENAVYILPSSLTFDNIKLRCNIVLCKYLLKYLEKQCFQEELLNLYSEAEELPDPWIKLLCKYNLQTFRPDTESRNTQLQAEYPGEIHRYGLIIDTTQGSFMLGISPHWRY